MASTTSTQGEQRNQSEDTDSSPFQLGNNDHPVIAIVTTPFTSNNYMTWSTAIHISLGAKEKLGFINSTIEKRTKGSAEYLKW